MSRKVLTATLTGASLAALLLLACDQGGGTQALQVPAGNGSITALMKARGLSEADVEAALKT